MAEQGTTPRTARGASVVAVVLAFVGIVAAALIWALHLAWFPIGVLIVPFIGGLMFFLPGLGLWEACLLGGAATAIGAVADAHRRKAGQPPGLARVGWIGGILAFSLGAGTLLVYF